MTQFQIGDKVTYSRQFVKSTFLDYTTANRRGTVEFISKENYGKNKLLKIQWDDDPVMGSALSCNIVRLDKKHLEHY